LGTTASKVVGAGWLSGEWLSEGQRGIGSPRNEVRWSESADLNSGRKSKLTGVSQEARHEVGASRLLLTSELSI